MRETFNQRYLAALRRASQDRQRLGFERHVKVDDRNGVYLKSGPAGSLNQPGDNLLFSVIPWRTSLK